MRNLSLFDLAFLASAAETSNDQILDDFEGYTAGQFLNTLNGGTNWNGAWAGRHGATGFLAEDNFEDSSIASLNGQNEGLGWTSAWVSRDGEFGLLAEDTFESYALDGLNGENGGSGWNGAWVSR